MFRVITRVFLIVVALAMTAVTAESAESLVAPPGAASLMPCNECESRQTGWEPFLEMPLWTAEFGDECQTGNDCAFCDRSEEDPDAECANTGESLNNWCEFGCIGSGLELALVTSVSRNDVQALSEMLSTPQSPFFFNAARGAIQARGCNGSSLIVLHIELSSSLASGLGEALEAQLLP
jgi:hypothetical protein